MKTKWTVLACALSLSVVPLVAGDAEINPLNVERRVLEVDLSLALQQYERVQMEAFEMRVGLALLDTEEDMTDVARAARFDLLTKRRKILETIADELRSTARRLAQEIADSVRE